METLVASKPRAVGVEETTAGQAVGPPRRLLGLRSASWVVAATSAISLLATPAAAQDCGIGEDDWDDFQLFRRCIQEHGLDAWTSEILHQAARLTTNPTIIQLLLEAGADANARNDRGLTPLHEGATTSNPVVTAHLLAAGADPNGLDNEGYTPLHFAAAQSGNRRVVTRLLGAGADPLVESNDGRTPLHSALRYAGEPGVVSELLEAGATENLTPLQLAALEGDSATAASMLAGGAVPRETDAYGWTSLHFAVPLAGPGVVSGLLEAGADPNARTVGGATALHLAARQATATVISQLLEAGADPNARDGEIEQALTPLHHAALSNDDLSVVLALLDAGADPAVRDARGQRPVDFARENDTITGSSAYRRLLVNQPSLLGGRPAGGDLDSTDGVRWGLQYYDEWSYDAVAGERVMVVMESEEIDAYLLVLGDDGTEVARDDDGGTGLNAQVDFLAPATGQYTILATSAGSGQSGRYTIRLERPTGGRSAAGHPRRTNGER